MMGHTVRITLPEALYERVKETAKATSLSLEEVLTRSVAISLPTLEHDLPPSIRSELAGLSLLSDREIKDITDGTLEDDKQAQLEVLAELQKQRPLTAVEQAILDQLMDEAQRLMLFKAEAYSLLARRGYAVFPPDNGLSG
jgi:predicted transcriptional regulator